MIFKIQNIWLTIIAARIPLDSAVSPNPTREPDGAGGQAQSLGFFRSIIRTELAANPLSLAEIGTVISDSTQEIQEAAKSVESKLEQTIDSIPEPNLDMDALGAVASSKAQEIEHAAEAAVESTASLLQEVASPSHKACLSGDGACEATEHKSLLDEIQRLAFPEHVQPYFFQSFPVQPNLKFSNTKQHTKEATQPSGALLENVTEEADGGARNGSSSGGAISSSGGAQNGTVHGKNPEKGQREATGGSDDEEEDRDEEEGEFPNGRFKSPEEIFDEKMAGRIAEYIGHIAIFLATLIAWCALGYFMSRSFGTLRLQSGPNADELEGARGKQCWYPALLIETSLLAYICFRLTLQLCIRFNVMLEMNGEMIAFFGGGGMQSPIAHPLSNAYLAGQGIVVSNLWILVVLFAFRMYWQVRMTDGLLSHYILRGAFMSTVLALGLEQVGFGLILGALASHRPQPGVMQQAQQPNLGLPFVMMLFVGLAEEFAKAIVLLSGTWLCVRPLLNSGVGTKSCLASLTESPRALMLAGFCVGAGFMVTENAKYLIQVSVSQFPPDGRSDNSHEFLRLLIVCMRIFANIHPWLTGLTAGRIAAVCFADGAQRERPYLTFCEFLTCLWPAVLLHGMYDFLVVILGAMGIFVIGATLVISVLCFMNLWLSFEDEEGTPKANDSMNAGNGEFNTQSVAGA